MIFYTAQEKKNVVLELFGYYQLQCIVAIILLFRKCFQTFRFVFGSLVKFSTRISRVPFALGSFFLSPLFANRCAVVNENLSALYFGTLEVVVIIENL